MQPHLLQLTHIPYDKGKCTQHFQPSLSLPHSLLDPRFITAMAANPLAVNLASAAGITITWGTWALAGLVPGLVALVGVPLLLYALYPPEMKDTPGARCFLHSFDLPSWPYHTPIRGCA